MDAARTLAYENARTFERDLNPRQREVLALIAAGKTNAEIAEALDLTFYGAKWNVSEILSKLGLSSREEAADYWRWRQSPRTRVSAAMRALIPAGLTARLLVSGGTLGVAAVAIFVAWMATRPRVEPLPIDLNRPYRMEILQQQPETYPVSYIIEWQDDTHWRVVRHESGSGGFSRTETVVHDGRFEWRDSDVSGLTIRRDLSIPGTNQAPQFPEAIGPAMRNDVQTLLYAYVRQAGDGLPTPATSQIVGHQRVLGRLTTIIEYRPFTIEWSQPTDSTPGSPIAAWGGGRVWLEEASMVVVRSAWADDIDATEPFVESSTFAITSFGQDPNFASGTFAFTPSKPVECEPHIESDPLCVR